MPEIGQALFAWRKLFLWLAIVAFPILAGCGSRTTQGARVTSYANLHKIGTAIRDYSSDHGARPQKLSDLLPRYIPLDQIGMFYVIDSDAKNVSRTPDWASNSSQIDRFSSYVYLGTNSVKDILAFEKPDLWKPSGAHALEVAVLFSDYHVQYVQRAKLRELIREVELMQK